MQLVQRLGIASLIVALVGLSACKSGICNGNGCADGFGKNDLANQQDDFGNPYFDDFGTGEDLAFPQPDFGNNGDLGHGHHHHDGGFPMEDLAFPQPDFGQPPPGVDFAQPPVNDLATKPDLGNTVVACETCLNATCSSDVSACQSDASCTTTLSCVVQSGCFTYAGGSSSFGNCVDSCVLSQSLTLPQTEAVLSEIGALAACAGSCVDSCGGN